MPPKTKRTNADARARAQARREQLRKQERNRRYGFIGLWTTLGLVVVLVIVLVVVNQKGTVSATKNLNAPAPAALVADLSSIPASTFATVGVSEASGSKPSVTGLQTVSGGAAVVKDGKPTFMYIGGEFCPYCASERWAIAAALSRFGTFSGLETTKSSGSDVYPDTPTLSFLHATYTSQYLNFDPAEIEDRAQKKLQTPSAAAEASFQKYDSQGGIPFYSINNQFIGSVQYSPAVLKGKTYEEVAAALKDPSTDIAKQALTAANILTAGICKATGDKPAAVCGTAEVKAAAAYLDTGGTGGGSTS
ncbi:MAG TPA: DUF929 family protein [Mycobacteriales bacterium]